MSGFLLIVVAVLPSVLLAQPDCADLGFGGDVRPAPGNDLGHCTSDADQCCTPRYLTFVENTVRKNMQEFLQDEFNDAIDGYLDDFDDLIDYLKENFTESIVDVLPGSNFINRSDPAFRAVIRSLMENLYIPESEEDDRDDRDGDDSDDDDSDDDDSDDDSDGDGDEKDDDLDLDFNDDPNDNDPDDDSFNPRRFAQSLGEILDKLIVRGLVAQYPEEEQCIQSNAPGSLNSEAVADLAKLVQELRRAVSTLRRIGAFLGTQKTRLSRATILQACVSRFIDLSFCSRCSKKTPPLCFNTCNALVRGCYSPYYTTLNRQYSRLWSVVRQVLRIANTTIKDVLETEKEIIDYETLIQELNSECGIDLREERSIKRDEDDEGHHDEEDGDHDDDSRDHSRDNDREGHHDSSDNDGAIPSGLVRRTFEMRGAFKYSDEGLELCQYGLVNSNCTAQVEQDNDRRYCNQTDICTSKCYCTDDGVNTRERDIEPFTFSDIDDQDKNPVLRIDMNELRGQAATIEDEDPVAEFLSSSTFRDVAPDGLEDDDNDGASYLVTSATVILLSLLLTFV